ncbi:MAG: gliding motility lipoprotein GldH [Bacteroidetes bacterium]|nr:gliding motility lipoprotein GldH [Bacteroidota bacterium]
MFRLPFILSISALTLMLNSCMPSPYFQKEISIPEFQWQYGFQPEFKVDIKDTNAHYNLYFIIRHTEAYPFSNIWLWAYIKEPGDTSFKRSRIEIPLAEQSGRWLGRGMGEIWEQRMPMTRNDAPMVFKKPGIYQIRLEQNMRINPLPDILQIGLRIEKTGTPILAKR